MSIPEKLRKKDFRFIKIVHGSKRPAEYNWVNANNYTWDNNEFQEYLKSASAYGVVCGFGNLAVIDCDNEKVMELVENNLPETFTVQTGSGGRHYYYIIPDLSKKVILQRGKIHYGEIQYSGSQVLGAGSFHPNGNKYVIINNKDIAVISIVDIKEAFKYIIKSSTFKDNLVISKVKLPIDKVANTIKTLRRNGEYGLQGSHPIHGSTNGMNFRIDLDKNLWHCFRCGSGGDTLSLIAMLEGYAKCHELIAGYFKKHPETFKKTLRVAKDKYGYDISDYMDNKYSEELHLIEIAEEIIKNNYFKILSGSTMSSAEIVFYSDGWFQKDGVTKIRGIINNKLGIGWTPTKESTIFGYILSKSELRTKSPVVQLTKNPNLINFKNGVLDLETMSLLPHSPDYEFFYQIPHNYNPMVKCPKIMEFLKSTLESEFIPFIQEMTGYIFYAKNIIPAIFYLYGSGGNGKTVFANLLREAVGRGLCSTKTLRSLATNRFSTYGIYGKLLNISTEEDVDTIATAILKELSSSDDISIEDKGKSAFEYRPVNKLITACNRIPAVKDSSEGWFQRQYVIPFLKTFRNTKKENQFLLDEIIVESEIEGFIVWAIEGLKRLLKNRKFSYPYDREKYYKMATYGIQIFIDEHYKIDYSDDWVIIDDVYEKLVKWQKDNKLPIVTKEALIKYLKSRGINMSSEIVNGEKKLATFKLVEV